MSLREKASICSGKDWWCTESFERLGVPSITMADGPHGLRKPREDSDFQEIRNSLEATCFPSAVSLASSWDRELINSVGRALGKECQAEDVSILLGPGVNIKRSPLGGRNFEYFSEDPYLTSEMATSYIKGVQSQGVGTSLKHFAANNQEYRRMTISAEIDERTLREIYLSAFEKPVKESHPWSVMAAYNRINGEYCSENRKLLTDILRDEWGFKGFVVSDWAGAVNDRAKGLSAGLDLEMPSSWGDGAERIIEALNRGKLSKSQLDKAVKRILKIAHKALEKNQENVSYSKESHHALARDIAAECMVLLKNEDNILPIDKNRKIAILGPIAKNPIFQGGGSSHVNPTETDIAYNKLKALLGKSGEVNYSEGYSLEEDDTNHKLVNDAVKVARDSELVLIFAGLPDRKESEGYDRDNLSLPRNQVHLIEKISKENEDIVVVLNNGSPVEMPWINKVKGILESYLSGQASGGAVADLLLGEKNPSGKLAETFPKNLQDNPSYLHFPGEGDRVEYREGIFVGYRYYDSKEVAPLFPFGHGLSYTDFKYDSLKLDKKKMTEKEELTVSLDIKNVGSRVGKEVIQLYIRDPESSVNKPEKELKEFAKVKLEPRERKTVNFTLNARSFAYYNTDINDWHVESGVYEILLGSSSRDIRLKGKINFQSTEQITNKITVHTTFGDLIEDPRSNKIIRRFLKSYMKKSDLLEKLDYSEENSFSAMIQYMPLRALTYFGGKNVDRPLIQDLVTKLNDAYIEEENKS